MTWTDKLVGSKEERAVSPVIGVILMVAITVILAAVIAAFVMDIGPGSEPVQGAVDVDDTDITISSAENLDTVQWGCDSNDPSNSNEISSPSVGQSQSHGCSSSITVVGMTDDGGESILYDDDL